MLNTKILPTGLLLLGLTFHSALAENGPVQGPEAPPTFEIDKAGKPAHIDFNINLTPISMLGMKFSGFSNRKLLIFYFSAVCPHCQHAIPYVQKLADELTAKGFESVAIAVKFNSEDDIHGFIRDYKVHLPVFQDAEKTFGDNYGTGSIPVLFLVDEKGGYIRYKSFDAALTPDEIKTEADKIVLAAKAKH